MESNNDVVQLNDWTYKVRCILLYGIHCLKKQRFWFSNNSLNPLLSFACTISRYSTCIWTLRCTLSINFCSFDFFSRDDHETIFCVIYFCRLPKVVAFCRTCFISKSAIINRVTGNSTVTFLYYLIPSR